MAETAKAAAPIAGDKLYQRRARQALPLLVRQAHAHEQITYGDLAEELHMPNARNLNYVLGSIGRSMQLLSKAWKEAVPPIQCLVVNKSTGLPGEGIGWFMSKRKEYRNLPRSRQREIVQAELAGVFAYPKWRKVLEALSLAYVVPDVGPLIRKASSFGGGEGEEHRRLKDYVAKHPQVIDLAPNTPRGEIEEPLPSGDSLDVSFKQKAEWIAAEVKPANSPVADVVRGLYQCVKYKAVMEAIQVTQGKPRAATAVLVLGGKFPTHLVPVRNMLGVTVFEGIVPRR